jgi:branched-chain amino acid transport system ATP-binding protein
MLSVKDLRVHYGKAEVLKGVSLEVPDGAIVAVIGSNGAGKSTLIKAISGCLTITSGEIYFNDQRVDKIKSHNLVKLGIVQIPEGRHIFPYMSVMENLRIGAYLRKDKSEIEKDLNDIFNRFPRLKERRAQRASTLSGGEQQMLAISRALMAKPKLLLLDEPSMGLSPIMVSEVGRIVTDINKLGISIILVEQNSRMALKLATIGYLMEVGKVVLQGQCSLMVNDERVKAGYLGGS